MSETLPEGWETLRIGDALRLINGAAFKPSQWSSAGLPIIRIQNLNNPKASFNRFDGELNPRFRVKHGDLLFAWSGTPGTSFGAHIWRGGDAWLNQHIFRVEFDARQFDRRFLQMAINRNLNDYIREAHGGAGLAHIPSGRFEAFELLPPPLAEQGRIVARLEALEARSRRAREKLAEVPAQLAQARQSLLAAAFRGTLTADWRKATASAWRRSPLAGLVVKMGSGATPRGGRESYQADGVPLIRSMNVRFEEFTDDGLAFLDDEQADALKSVEVKTGDVLFNITGASIGRVCTAPSKMEGARVNQHVMRIRPTAELNGEFLAAYLASPEMQGFVFQNETGTTRQALTKGQIESFLIPLPPLAEQHEIVRRLNAAFARLDAAAAAHAAAVAELDRLDQSLLARAFSGGLVAQSAAVATTVPAAPSPRSALKPKSYLTQLVPALLRVHGRSLALDQINSALALLHSPRAARDRVFRELGALEALEYFTGWSQTHEDGALTAAINDLLKIGTLSQTKDRESHTMLHLVGKLPPIAPEVETDARHIATFIEHIPARAPDVAPAVSNRAAASSPRSRGQTRLKTQTPV